jgi:molybdate transport system regulatory protein
MRLHVKICLERDGGKAFGDGAADLLGRVERVGSLRGAAAEIGMSYSQAWHLVRGLERRLGFELLDAQAGGSSGGASRLTDQARLWLETYEVFRRECQAFIVEAFGRHLGPLLETYDVAEPGRRGGGLPAGSGSPAEPSPGPAPESGSKRA